MKLKHTFRTSLLKLHANLIPKYKGIGIILVVVFIGLSIYYAFYAGVFILKTVNISGNQNIIIDDATIKTYFNSYLARSMFKVPTLTLMRNIKNDYYAIDSIRIVKELPDSVNVYYRTKDPVYVFEAGDKSYLIDSESTVIFIGASGSFDEIIRVRQIDPLELSVGQKFDSVRVDIVNKIALFPWSDTSCEGVDLQFDANMLTVSTLCNSTNSTVSVTIIIAQNKNIDTQLNDLETLLKSQLNNHLKVTIDLRFDKAVIRYQ